MSLTDSNNIFTYAENVAEKDRWFDIRDLKRNYDLLRIVMLKITMTKWHGFFSTYYEETDIVNFNLFSLCIMLFLAFLH